MINTLLNNDILLMVIVLIWGICIAVSKKYVWICACAEFVLIALFAHLFYSFVSSQLISIIYHCELNIISPAFGVDDWQTMLQFHIQASISILLASFAGFGIAMCGKCVLSELLKWRRWLSRSEQYQISLGTHSPPQPSIPLQPLWRDFATV